MKQGFTADMGNYEISIKYSDKARRKGLMKFKAKNNNGEFTVSLREMTELIVRHLNKEHMDILNVKSKHLPMVHGLRQIHAVATKDYKAGDTITFDFIQPMPLDIAVAEAALNMYLVQSDKPILMSEKYLQKARKALTEEKIENQKNLNNEIMQIMQNAEKHRQELSSEFEQSDTEPELIESIYNK